MGESGAHRLPRPMHHVRKARLPREVSTQDDLVHQVAEGPAEARHRPAVRDRAHRDVILPRVAGEKCLEDRQQDDERSRAVRASQPAERHCELAVEDHDLGGAAVASDRLARPIGGQVEPRQLARELLSPERPETFPCRPRQHLGLPSGELLTGRPRGRERGRKPRCVGVIERPELPHEDPVRPAVCRDVVRRDEEDVVLGRRGEEHRPEHRTALEVEGAMGLIRYSPHQLLGGPPFGVDLHETITTVAHLGHERAIQDSVGGPDRIVPFRHAGPSLLERANVHSRADPPSGHCVVGGALRGESLEEPGTSLPVRSGITADHAHGHSFCRG